MALLDDAERILARAAAMQERASKLRKKGDAKVAQAKALLPMPLWDAADRRH
jgi:hypothetical protein